MTKRRDLRSAGTVGCNALYEDGWITIGPDGHIKVISPKRLLAGRLKAHPKQLKD
jgi:hypothetical protein